MIQEQDPEEREPGSLVSRFCNMCSLHAVVLLETDTFIQHLKHLKQPFLYWKSAFLLFFFQVEFCESWICNNKEHPPILSLFIIYYMPR